MLLPIFLIVLVDIFGLTLVIPLLAIYSEQLGATPLQATLLLSVYAVCQMVSGPLLGRASDRTGRKPMLLISQLGTFVGFLIMARAQSLAVLYLARIIDGATAGNLSLAQAMIADNTPPERRARAFGLLGIAFGLGFFIGPTLTGYLVHYGLRTPIYAAAALSALSILGTLVLLPRQAPPAAAVEDVGPGGRRLGVLSWGSYARFFAPGPLRGLLLQYFLFAFAFATFTSGFALFAERRFVWRGQPFTPREIGYLFAYSGFLGIILQGGLIGRLVKRFGEARLAVTGFVTMGAAYVALGLIGSVAALIAVATVAAYGTGVLRPALSSQISRTAGPRAQGVVLGLNQSLMSLAQIVAPVAAGALIERAHLTAWAGMAGVAGLLGAVVAVRGRAAAPKLTAPAA